MFAFQQKALAEKNARDLEAQREQSERHVSRDTLIKYPYIIHPSVSEISKDTSLKMMPTIFGLFVVNVSPLISIYCLASINTY